MATSQANQQRRTLLLTGASRGIGHATVKRFQFLSIHGFHMKCS